MRFWRHMPTGSKPAQALRIAQSIGCDTVQIFVTNPRGWRAPEPNPHAEELFRHAAEECGIAPVVVHATYLINLASPRDDFFESSVALLRATLDRAARHGASSVVFHIGSHGGAGFDISTPEGAAATLDAADRAIGLRCVPVIHVNDTPKALGSHVDNHARIGEGVIPLVGLGALLRDPRLDGAAMLLETPIKELAVGKYDWDAEREHLARARALAGVAMPAL